MKFLLSNLRLLLRKFKTVVAINVIGLSVAFAVTLVVSIQVYYDFTYDRKFDNSKKIFIAEENWGGGFGTLRALNCETAELWKESIPEIDDYCLQSTYLMNTSLRKVEDGENGVWHDADINRYSKGFLDVFTPEILSGNAGLTFEEKGHCIIPETMAAAIFEGEDPIGKVLVSAGDEQFVVDAVYRDFPKNSSIGNAILTYAERQEANMHNFTGYFLFDPADKDAIMEKVNDRETWVKGDNDRYMNFSFFMTSLPDYYLHGGDGGSGTKNIQFTMYLLIIGLLILAVAIINFVNLSMAMAPSRVRNINIHKILGIGKTNLRISLSLESVFVSLVAVAIGLLIVYWFGSSGFTGFFTADLSLSGNIPLVAVTVAVLLLVAFAVGAYSSYYASSFDEAIALKSSFAMGRKGAGLRNTLIVVQFATAIFFICFSAFVKLQYDYMSDYSVGYQKENIVSFHTDGEVSASVFSEELKRNPEVLGVTSAFDMPGSVGSRNGTNFGDKKVLFHMWRVAPDFLDFFGIGIEEGKDFDPTLGEEQTIVNEEFLRKHELTAEDVLNKETGPNWNRGRIVGICDDINFESLHQPVKPLAFSTEVGEQPVNRIAFVKITGNNVRETLDFINDTWEKLSGKTVQPEFLDQELNKLYIREFNTSRLIGILGIVAVVIAIMGVYGLIMFNARYKTREIAIRKVNGATITDVAVMLNRNMLVLIAIAFVIVAPVTFYVISKWIGAFAFRVPTPWWLYPAAGILVLLISAATVSWQSYRAAAANPVNALKTE